MTRLKKTDLHFKLTDILTASCVIVIFHFIIDPEGKTAKSAAI
jgi:hypothetical protein